MVAITYTIQRKEGITMTDIIKLCDIVECSECPKYGDDSDGQEG